MDLDVTAVVCVTARGILSAARHHSAADVDHWGDRLDTLHLTKVSGPASVPLLILYKCDAD